MLTPADEAASFGPLSVLSLLSLRRTSSFLLTLGACPLVPPGRETCEQKAHRVQVRYTLPHQEKIGTTCFSR